MTRIICVSRDVSFLDAEGRARRAYSLRKGDSVLSSGSLPIEILGVELKRKSVVEIGGTEVSENQEIHVYRIPHTINLSEERKIDLCLFPQTKVQAGRYCPKKYSLYRRGAFWKHRETDEEPYSIAKRCAISGEHLPDILLKNSRKVMEQALSGILATSSDFCLFPPGSETLWYSLGFGEWKGKKQALDDICIGKFCSLREEIFPKFVGEREVVELLLNEDVPIFLEDFTVI
nr:hypothetical protein [Marseillevirus cajuinensis]